MCIIPYSTLSSHHLAPLNGSLATETVDVDTARAGALPGELCETAILRGRTDVATAVANLGLGGGETCCSEAAKEDGVDVELHFDSV